MIILAFVASGTVPAGFAWNVWLPYFAGSVILAAGLANVIKERGLHKRGLEKFIALGPMFFAVPLAVFGTEHFTAAKFVTLIVPGWIPAHLFWVLFVGACLIGAALSIAARRYAGLAAALLAVMFLLFVLLIHIPGIVGAPGNRILWTVALRDLAFSGGALSLAVTYAQAWIANVTSRVMTFARLFLGIPIVFFGVEQFPHPELAPGVPLAKLTPLWIPAHSTWGYLTGAVFVLSGLILIVNKETRLTATYLGLIIFLLVLLIYVPVVVANPSDIGNGLNYLVDTLLLSGSTLAFAGAKDVLGDGPRNAAPITLPGPDS